jgi:hypothetical protein
MEVSSTGALAAFQSILAEIIAEATETIDVTRQKAARGDMHAILKLEIREAQQPQNETFLQMVNDQTLNVLA